jgi:hypothetical protein
MVLTVLNLTVLQVRLSCLLWGAEHAEVVVLVAGCCVAFSLVPAPVWINTLESRRRLGLDEIVDDDGVDYDAVHHRSHKCLNFQWNFQCIRIGLLPLRLPLTPFAAR